MSPGKSNVQAMKFVLTCEHASAEILSKYVGIFKKEPSVHQTHEAFDPGAFDLFKQLQKLADFSFYHSTGRLLIEVNRSEHHPKLFSRFSKNLDKREKEEIKRQYYFPYRNRVEEQIRKLTEKSEDVFHLSVHSFTPVLNGKKRNCDIGLLYDPAREKEKEICQKLKWEIQKVSEYKVRMNYPYLGKADGFTTYLRKRFSSNYQGIELEVNQKFVSDNKMDKRLKIVLKEALQQILE